MKKKRRSFIKNKGSPRNDSEKRITPSSCCSESGYLVNLHNLFEVGEAKAMKTKTCLCICVYKRSTMNKNMYI